LWVKVMSNKRDLNQFKSLFYLAGGIKLEISFRLILKTRWTAAAML
jgi:hypothetical protein